ncbi:hypothetical protein IQ279_08350 [Streptomyces verrucosisporus]|uniref:hypothetical protein n=1 Tax=Streptomyces verrucosisporus TaxID=1695161 RepID=UPI0019D043D5|nr:hypothetical protein [Streptomyces verrucosisporus]MBN3929649.1 hypothetical protein [Streptomyces verrucosisporus]
MRSPAEPTRQRTRLLASAAGALLLGLGTAACSVQERNYEIPSALCGTAVSPDLTTPLLPPGDTFSTTVSDRVEGVRRCLVSVDGEQVLALSTEWWKKGTSLRKAALVIPNVDPDDKETRDGRYLYSDTGAVGKVACSDPRKADGDLFVAVRVNGPGKPDEAAMKKLISAYAEAVGKSGECT